MARAKSINGRNPPTPETAATLGFEAKLWQSRINAVLREYLDRQ